MKNEKGASKWFIIFLIALAIAAGLYWSKYFAKPMATVMMQGADQAKPAIEQAGQAKASMDSVTRAAEDISKKANEEAGKTDKTE